MWGLLVSWWQASHLAWWKKKQQKNIERREEMRHANTMAWKEPRSTSTFSRTKRGLNKNPFPSVRVITKWTDTFANQKNKMEMLPGTQTNEGSGPLWKEETTPIRATWPELRRSLDAVSHLTWKKTKHSGVMLSGIDWFYCDYSWRK